MSSHMVASDKLWQPLTCTIILHKNDLWHIFNTDNLI